MLYVRALDTGEPVRGATVKLEGYCCRSSAKSAYAQVSETTDADGRVAFEPLGWNSINRVSVTSGDDVLVIDPRERLPQLRQQPLVEQRLVAQLAARDLDSGERQRRHARLRLHRAADLPARRDGLRERLRAQQGARRAARAGRPVALRPRRSIGPDGTQYPLAAKTVSRSAASRRASRRATSPTGDFTVSLYDKQPRHRRWRTAPSRSRRTASPRSRCSSRGAARAQRRAVQGEGRRALLRRRQRRQPAHLLDGDAAAVRLGAEGPAGLPVRRARRSSRGPRAQRRAGRHLAAGRARRRRRGRDHHQPAARPRRLGAHLPLRGDRDRSRRAAGDGLHRGEGAARRSCWA